MNLDHKKLTHLPELPRALTKLSVSFNALKEVDQLSRLGSLQELRLQNNYITHLPNLSDQLSVLVAKNNFLSDLPALPALENVHLDNNEFCQLPLTLGQCTRLQNLSLNLNKLCFLELPSWPLLRELSLDQNRLDQVPALGKLCNLERLSLAHNKLVELGEICKLAKLKTLILSHNKLDQVTDLGDCPLIKLSLDNNDLRKVEALPRSLELLHLNNNHLEQLRLELPALKKLRVDQNDLIELDLSRLTNLTQLCACKNRLTLCKLPSQVSQVLLSSNQLERVTIRSSLTVLALQHNPIKHLPLETANLALDWLDLNFVRAII